MAGFDSAIGHWADVEEEIAVSADYTDERVDALLERFHPVVGLPGPLVADGHAGFPGAVVLEFADFLFGGVVVGGESCAIVYDDVGLEGPDHFEKVFGVPVLCGAAQAVEPDNIDLAVVGADFTKLAVKVFDIGGMVRRAVGGVVPIDGRVVITEFQAAFVARIGELFYDIAFEGGIGDFVVGELAVEH